MTENELRRLAHAANDLRPDWPISSLTTFLRRPEIANRPGRDVAVALAWVATDTKLDGTPASDTPKRLLETGPWWLAASVHDGTVRGNHPPRKNETCAKSGHEGYRASGCAGCHADELTGEQTPRRRDTSSVDHAAGMAAVRAALNTRTKGDA